MHEQICDMEANDTISPNKLSEFDKQKVVRLLFETRCNNDNNIVFCRAYSTESCWLGQIRKYRPIHIKFR